MVDDFSRTWTFLLKKKSNVSNILKQFYNIVSNQFKKIIKIVRTNNGTEFVNKSCKDIFQERGIVHHRTCAYTPQQNSVVERKYKHLLQVARALMFESNLPKAF